MSPGSTASDSTLPSLSASVVVVMSSTSHLTATDSSYMVQATPVGGSSIEVNPPKIPLPSEKSDPLGPDPVPSEVNLVHTSIPSDATATENDESVSEAQSEEEEEAMQAQGSNSNGDQLHISEEREDGEVFSDNLRLSISGHMTSDSSLQVDCVECVPSNIIVTNGNHNGNDVPPNGDENLKHIQIPSTLNPQSTMDAQAAADSSPGGISYPLDTSDGMETVLEPSTSINGHAQNASNVEERNKSGDKEYERLSGDVPSPTPQVPQDIANELLNEKNVTLLEEPRHSDSSSNGGSVSDESIPDSNSSLVIEKNSIKTESSFNGDGGNTGKVGENILKLESSFDKGSQTADEVNQGSFPGSESVTTSEVPVVNNDTENHNESHSSSSDIGNEINSSNDSKSKLPLPSQQKERSVFLRLSNHIEDLETNMTLFSIFLDQISTRY